MKKINSVLVKEDPKKLYMVFIEFQKEIMEGKYKAPIDFMKDKEQITKRLIYMHLYKNNAEIKVPYTVFKDENDRILQNFKKKLIDVVEEHYYDRKAIFFLKMYSEEIYDMLKKTDIDEKYLNMNREDLLDQMSYENIEDEDALIIEKVMDDFVKGIKFTK